MTATGDIPANRSQFCAVVSASVDQSSFQVTIFGGLNVFTKHIFEDVYVLTVPSFRWIKVNPKNDYEATTGSNGRAGHRCIIYKDAQMVVLGGLVKVDNDEMACDTAHPPLRVLDTSSYTWKNVFDPSIEYRIPDIVTKVIGGK